MGNNEKKSEDTLIIVDASVTESSLSGNDFISQSNSLVETTKSNPESDMWEPVIGTIFDSKYKIEEKLGEGGMGVVYRANHIFIDRPVAIKFLRKEYLTDSAAIERFKLEARAAARIHHPNVTAILDFGVTDGNFYLVMEYLEGYSLRQQLKTNGALTLKDTIKIMAQVCDALDAAHKSNIVHKDLKPDNIFLHTKEGIEQVKVLDFGIAEILGKSSDIDENPNAFAGTPHYMSPEQCQNDPVSPATDIYSLGIILFEMLTGQLPFNDNSAVKIVLKHLSSPPPKLSDISNTIPEEFEAIVAKALSKNAEKRYQSATLLLEDLQKAEKSSDVVLDTVQEVNSGQPSIVCSNPKCGQLGKTGNKRCPRCQALAVGSLLRHRYLIEKMVGKGGFGTTYLVKDLDCFDEHRILKELTLNIKDEDPTELKDMAERLFKREAQVLLNLHHSGIPRLYAYFAEESFSYLVQDFIPGQTLSEDLKKRKATVSEQEAISILNSLADILDYLHGHNPPVIHRDIKPHNLMRHEDGRIMLIDFGAVCQAVANPQVNHTVIGSLGYAPPEQFLGQTTPQSDLYAVGASIIYLLTGIPPRLLLSNSLTKLEMELDGKIKPELLLLLKDLVNPELKKRLPTTSDLKNRLQAISNPSANVTVNPLTINSSSNITNSPAPPLAASLTVAKEPIAPTVQPPPLTSGGHHRPSLSEAFAKITGTLPNLSTPTSQPTTTTGKPTPSSVNKEQPPLLSTHLVSQPNQPPTNSSAPSLARSFSNPLPLGQQPLIKANTPSPSSPISNTSNPISNSLPTSSQKPIGYQQVIQPTITPEKPSTAKPATPSLGQVLTNKPQMSQPQPTPVTKEAPKQPGIDFQAVAHFSYEVESMLRLIDYGTYFAILGVTADASTQQIMDAYRELSEKFHPTKYLHLSNYNPNLQNDLTKISARLYEAFETLMDQTKRNLYKRSFRTGTFDQLKPPDKR